VFLCDQHGRPFKGRGRPLKKGEKAVAKDLLRKRLTRSHEDRNRDFDFDIHYPDLGLA
jgi:hypothetical protein